MKITKTLVAIAGIFVLVLILFAAPAAAQNTRINIVQQTDLNIPPGAGNYLLTVIDGKLVALKLGAGLRIEIIDGVATLAAVPVVPPGTTNRIVSAVPSRNSDGTYVIQDSGTLSNVVVYVNGVRVKPGLDYDLNGNILVPREWVWQPDTLVLVDYER